MDFSFLELLSYGLTPPPRLPDHICNRLQSRPGRSITGPCAVSESFRFWPLLGRRPRLSNR